MGAKLEMSTHPEDISDCHQSFGAAVKGHIINALVMEQLHAHFGKGQYHGCIRSYLLTQPQQSPQAMSS